jgi:type I restriction enzyme, S subunit
MSGRIASVWIGADKLGDRLDTRSYKPWVLSYTEACRSFPGRVIKLGDKEVCEYIARGAGGGNASMTEVAVFKAKEVTGYGISQPEVFLDHCADELLLQKGDIVLTSSGIGTIGRADIFGGFKAEDNIQKACVDNHVAVIRLRGSLLIPEYLYAFLNSRFGKAWSEWGTTGSTRLLELSASKVRSFLIPVPDRSFQHYIAAKVELAERCRAEASKLWHAATNLLSEAVGASLDDLTFSPQTPQDVNGPGYKVASLNPTVAFVDPSKITGYIGAQFFHPRRTKALLVIDKSDLKAKRLIDLAFRVLDRMPAAILKSEALPYVGLANIDSPTGFISGDSSEDIEGVCAKFQAGDILFSKLRPYLNKVTICPKHIPKAGGSTELVIYRAYEGIDPYFLFFVLKSPLVFNQVLNITSGLTHPRVDPDLIDEVLIPLPAEPIQTNLSRYAKDCLKLLYKASTLVSAAKADVEDLIEGTLDTDAILSGKVKPPTWEAIIAAIGKEG